MRRSVPFLAAAVLAFASGCRGTPPATPPATSAVELPPIDPTALDRQVSPCDDFFRFACGGWLDHTQIPADQAAWSRGFHYLFEHNLGLLREVCEADAAGKADPADPFADKVGSFYAACMDEAATEAQGRNDLAQEWARLDAVKDAGGLVEEMAREQLANVNAGFALIGDQDAKDAKQVIAILWQGGLTLPDRDYYTSQDEKQVAIRARYLVHLRGMLALAGVPEKDAARQAEAVLSLETALADAHWTPTELRDPNRVYNRVNRDGLEKLAPSFGWARYFQALGAPGIQAVSVSTPKFVERLGKLVSETPLESWKAYLRWQVLNRMAGIRALPKAFVDKDFAFNSESFTGAKELEPRWKFCVQAVDGALGEALGAGYVRRHFGVEGKARTVKLVEEIEKAMGRDLDTVAWMDAPTRAKAQQKLAAIANKIGFPGQWRDYSALEVGRASHASNAFAAARFESRRSLAKIGKPVDRAEWLMSAPTVNAYYNANMNEMVFPAGILQPPFFNRRAPEVFNYGAIGMVVGHELTHGFDDEGRRFDGDGNLTDWWTEPVGKEFERRTKCLVDQYAGYESIPGAKVNGELTLGENIADLGGLKLSWAAHQASRADERAVEGFSPDQQFFLGYGQSWCFKARDEYARMAVNVDPHSPARFRVNGPLANLPEFAQAFSCKPGSPMVRPAEKRCEIW